MFKYQRTELISVPCNVGGATALETDSIPVYGKPFKHLIKKHFNLLVSIFMLLVGLLIFLDFHRCPLSTIVYSW